MSGRDEIVTVGAGRRALMGVTLLALAGIVTPASAAPAEVTGSIEVDGITRSYLLYVPPSLPKEGKFPLLLVFHGGGGHARGMGRFTRFGKLADEEKFIVVYPESFNRNWNDTRGLSPADDVGFVRGLIEKLQGQVPVDVKRVYATGISNGGFFSQRLACELSDRIAAVASVAATMPETLMPVCKPSRPVAVMFVHGTKDPLVRIEGGQILRDRGRNVSLEDAIRFWRDRDQTSSEPKTENFPDRVKDKTRIRLDVYGGGREGTEVAAYVVENGGHTWPGAAQYLPAFIVGKVSRNLDATAVIWEFLSRHAVP